MSVLECMCIWWIEACLCQSLGKISYRYRVKCEECEKEFDSDYVEAHSRIVPSGRKLRCLPVVESSQLKLSGFFSKSSAAVESPGQT